MSAQPEVHARKPLTSEQVYTSEDFMSMNGLYWGLRIETLMQIIGCTERAHGIGAVAAQPEAPAPKQEAQPAPSAPALPDLLRAAIEDLLHSDFCRPSCQAGAVARCMCLKCAKERALEAIKLESSMPSSSLCGFDLVSHLQRQIQFSETTFGPGNRLEGVADHIRKELVEVVESGGSLEEWVDVIILAFDGAWRSGASAEEVVAAIVAKQTKNEARTWPDWRTAAPGKAIEHDRTGD